MYKIIVADDERIECIALERMLQEFPEPLKIIESAGNGEELVLRIEKEKPDIAIVDISMPGLNGLEAIDIIHQRHANIKIIIHSAYHEYDFMQKAIRLGAVDYLLKPVTREKLYDAVRQSCLLLDQEYGVMQLQRKNEDTIDEMQEVLKSEIMMSLLISEPDENSFRLFQKNHGNFQESGVIFACISRDRGIKAAIIYNKIKSVLNRFCIFLGAVSQEVIYIYLFSGATVNVLNRQEWINQVLEEINKSIRSLCPSGLFLGISSWKSGFGEALAAVREARISLQMADGIEPVRQFREKSSRQSLQALPVELENPDIEAIPDQIDDIFKRPDVTELPLFSLKVWAIELIDQFQEKKAATGAFFRVENSFTQAWEELQCIEEVSALADWIKQKLVQIQTHNNQKKTSVYVEKCLKYMEQNYSKEITLEGTAEYVGVSSFYLTRLLRQELDRSFVKILIDIRMKNAVELLWRGELSAKEIGAAVGYPNPVYFSRVFKKNMGMTIRQLREYLQQEVVFAETDEEM